MIVAFRRGEAFFAPVAMAARKEAALKNVGAQHVRLQNRHGAFAQQSQA